MRTQARPFSVEIKSRRRNAPPAIPASAARPDDWIDAIPPDDLPERDVHEDLPAPAAQSEARKKAERLFGRLNGHTQPSETQDEAGPQEAPAPARDVPAPRVLPDLLAAAREDERTKIEKPKRTRVPKPRLEQPAPVASEPVTGFPLAPTGHAQAAMSQRRRITERASKLPPGQRWKERRLPRVCWDR
jgi:hypothetical protein